MLSLDDPRWASLMHCYHSAADTPGVLAQFRSELVAGNVSNEVTEKLFASLLHQGDVYQATVFATPHVVAAAAEARAEHRRLALHFVAAAARGFDGCNRAEYADADAWSEFDDAIVAARPLAIATARTATGDDILEDLMAIAALHGWHRIAASIENLNDGGADVECLSCGAHLEVDYADVDIDRAGHASALAKGRERLRSATFSAQDEAPLELLAALAAEVDATDAANMVLDLGGSMPCPECDEPIFPASPEAAF